MNARIAPVLLLVATALSPLTAATAGATPPPGPGDLQVGGPAVVPPSLAFYGSAGYEADGQVEFRAVLDKPALHHVDFDYAVHHIDTVDADFGFLVGNVQFAPGQTEVAFTVAVAQGDEVELRERFLLKASDPNGLDLYDDTAHASIMDGDGPLLSVGDAQVVEGDEGSTVLVFPITPSYPADDIFTVRAVTAIVGFGAEPPGDYAATDVEVVFGVNSPGETVQVPVHGDALVEADELLLLVLDPPSIGGLDDATAVGRILDDDVPTVSVDGVALPEGTGGPTGFHFTVALDQPAQDEVTVVATPTDGTATAPGDWQGVPVEVTFEPGQTEADVVVSVVGDSEIEADETLTVVLSDATGAALGDSEGLGTILDDDADAEPAQDDADADADAAGGTDGSADDGTEVASAESERSTLPRTGTTAVTIGAAGLVLVLAGAAARAARRRLV